MSVALAVLGELLTEAEHALDEIPSYRHQARDRATDRVQALREARNRVLAAESRFRDDERTERFLHRAQV